MRLSPTWGVLETEYLQFLGKDKYLNEVLEQGAIRARESAEGTMRDVRSAVELGL